jgi:hypothetical protein
MDREINDNISRDLIINIHEVFNIHFFITRTGEVFRKCNWVLTDSRFIYRALTKGNDINYMRPIGQSPWNIACLLLY